MRDGAPDGGVGVEDDVAGGVVGRPDRQRGDQLPAAGLGQDPAAQPGSDEMQFCLRHLPFHAQHEAIIKIARVIEAVFVADQGAGQPAELEELVPVGGVAGEPGAFQAEHDPGPAQGHLGDQCWNPSRSAALAPEWPWSMSITVIWAAAQPSAIALPRRSYWRIADSVLLMTCLRVDWRTYSRAVLDRWAAVTFEDAVSVSTGAPFPAKGGIQRLRPGQVGCRPARRRVRPEHG